MTIEVQITADEFNRFENEVLRGQLVLNKLRAAGIPVKGVLWVHGIETGALAMHYDEMFDVLVYRWSEEGEFIADTLKAEREMFETWIRSDDSDPRLQRCAEFPDQYEDIETDRLWNCWQERAKVSP